MLKIRLRRMGKKHQPCYRIVIAEHTKHVKGKYIKKVGFYNPIKKELVLKKEEIINWINKGAQPSNTVAKLLLSQGLKHKLIVVKKFRAKNKEEINAEKKQKEEEKTKESENKETKKIEFETKVEQEKVEATTLKEEVSNSAKAEAEQDSGTKKPSV